MQKADAPMVTVNTTSVRWRSIIASADRALFDVMRDRLIACKILRALPAGSNQS